MSRRAGLSNNGFSPALLPHRHKQRRSSSNKHIIDSLFRIEPTVPAATMSLAQPTTITSSSANKQHESIVPSDGAERGLAPTVDRSKFAKVSKAALARLDVAKAKLLALMQHFHACGTADTMPPGEHKIIPFLPPECHLVGHCWSELRRWVERNYPGWAVSRIEVPPEAKRLMKNPRKSTMYHVRAVYTKTQSLAASVALMKTTPPPLPMTPSSNMTHFHSLLAPIVVPAGGLKITISDAEEPTNNHVWIKAILQDSPLVGKIAVGDWLVVVNGINVIGHNSKGIADLLRVGVTSSTRTLQVARRMAVYHPMVTAASATEHGAKFVSHEKTEPVLAASPVTAETTTQPMAKETAGTASAVVTKPTTTPSEGLAATTTETIKTTQPTAKENASSSVLPGAATAVRKSSAPPTAADDECPSASPNKKQRLGDTTNAAPEQPLAEPSADDM